jgi:hypothetical protein
MLANLSERGLEPVEGYQVQQARLGLSWGADGTRLDQATYEWSVNVEAENESDERESYKAAIQQDALSGEILDVELRPADVSQGDRSADGDASTDQGTSPTADESDRNETGGDGDGVADGGSDGPRRTPAVGALALGLTFAVLARQRAGGRS